MHLALTCFILLSTTYFVLSAQNSASDVNIRILSSLYGYDGCIGGVNNFDTEEEYLDDLKTNRHCTVEDGRTNVADSTRISLICGYIFQRLSWLDGMPVVFNYPLEMSPNADDFEVVLSDGSVIIPDCVMMGPANEKNELDTVLFLSTKLGDGVRDGVRPVEIRVTGEVNLVTDTGLVSARGLSYVSDPDRDSNYLSSTVRLVSAKLWDAAANPENFTHPLWPLPSFTYPNDCVSLYPTTSHVLRTTCSGGVTSNGIASIMPGNRNVFRLVTPGGGEVTYLGLADLGQNTGENVETAYDYVQDGDNYVDICLDLAGDQADVLGSEELELVVLCDPGLEDSVLYPPKGKPYACQPQTVRLQSSHDNSKRFLMYWET